MDNFTDPYIGGHKAELGLELLGKFWSVPHHCSVEGCPGRENKRKLELFDEMLNSLEQAPKPARFRHEDAEQDKAAARTFRESYLRWEASKNGLLREAKGEK